MKKQTEKIIMDLTGSYPAKTTFGIKFEKAQMFLSLVGTYIVHLKVPGLKMITMNH